MYRRPSIACALLLVTLAAAASAQSPVFTSFEPPTYALGQIQNQDGWVYVTGDATKQVVQNAVVFAGAQAAGVDSNGVAGINEMGRYYNLSLPNQTLRIDLMVYIQNTSQAHNWWSIDPQAPSGDFIAFQVNSSGNLQLVGAVNTVTSVAFPYNQWNSMRLDINFVSRRVNAYFNGAPIATNLAFHPNSGSSTDLLGITFASLGAAQTEKMFIDNLSVGGIMDEASGVFQLKYFNTNYGSGQITISNAGSSSSGSDPSNDATGTLCANFYSFDPNEEMQTCCACPVTPNGLSSLNINEDILAQNLIVNPSSAITVKVLFTSKAGQNSGGICDPTRVTTFSLAKGGLAWGANLRNVTFQGSPPVAVKAVTETKFTNAELSAAELTKLATYCQYIKILGSQVTGICKSCQSGARGAIGQ